MAKHSSQSPDLLDMTVINLPTRDQMPAIAYKVERDAARAEAELNGGREIVSKFAGLLMGLFGDSA